VVRSERLRYEPIDESHAAGLLAALDHPDVGTYIGGPDVTDLDALVRRIAHLRTGPAAAGERWINHVVLRRSDDVVVGRLEATSYGTWGEVAYVFGPAHWGAGFATEAMAWFLAHLRHVEHLDEVWAAVHPENRRSIALLERLGFDERPPPADRPLGSADDVDRTFVRHLS
jgi:ribosomal-protein-alanine N-acetyltransferase